MFRIRNTPTQSGATAIQVVKYVSRKTVVIKHVGSSKNPKDLELLRIAAYRWIDKHTSQMRLFSRKEGKTTSDSPVLLLKDSQLISTSLVFVYETLCKMCRHFGFGRLPIDHKERGLLLDLVIARLIHPSSKLESLQYLKEQFGVDYKKDYVYRRLLKWGELKQKVEKTMVNFAKYQLGFNFQIVFYDVTTLYFESFKNDDELKQCGFSKDNKFNQPQIMIGLMVNEQGFPVSYGIFPGNKFEGHTFIPMIESLIQEHNIASLTVVADAAMISQNNVDQLIVRKLHYIVGARLGNLSQKLIKQIQQNLNRKDKSTTKISTDRGDLICSFSQKRYRKNKYETEKQIQKAKEAINNPGKRKRLKFLTTKNTKPVLNEKLISKSKLLWGIRGYYSNVPSNSNEQIISQYKQLWQVEKSFRIAKSDLQTRPIYHRKTKAIKAHILICFMALSIAKYMEIKSGFSVKKCINILKSVKDAKIKNQLGQIITLRSEVPENVDSLLKVINLSH